MQDVSDSSHLLVKELEQETLKSALEFIGVHSTFSVNSVSFFQLRNYLIRVAIPSEISNIQDQRYKRSFHSCSKHSNTPGSNTTFTERLHYRTPQEIHNALTVSVAMNVMFLLLNEESNLWTVQENFRPRELLIRVLVPQEWHALNSITELRREEKIRCLIDCLFYKCDPMKECTVVQSANPIVCEVASKLVIFPTELLQQKTLGINKLPITSQIILNIIAASQGQGVLFTVPRLSSQSNQRDMDDDRSEDLIQSELCSPNRSTKEDEEETLRGFTNLTKVTATSLSLNELLLEVDPSGYHKSRRFVSLRFLEQQRIVECLRVFDFDTNCFEERIYLSKLSPRGSWPMPFLPTLPQSHCNKSHVTVETELGSGQYNNSYVSYHTNTCSPSLFRRLVPWSQFDLPKRHNTTYEYRDTDWQRPASCSELAALGLSKDKIRTFGILYSLHTTTAMQGARNKENKGSEVNNYDFLFPFLFMEQPSEKDINICLTNCSSIIGSVQILGGIPCTLCTADMFPVAHHILSLIEGQRMLRTNMVMSLIRALVCSYTRAREGLLLTANGEDQRRDANRSSTILRCHSFSPHNCSILVDRRLSNFIASTVMFSDFSFVFTVLSIRNNDCINESENIDNNGVREQCGALVMRQTDPFWIDLSSRVISKMLISDVSKCKFIPRKLPPRTRIQRDFRLPVSSQTSGFVSTYGCETSLTTAVSPYMKKTNLVDLWRGSMAPITELSVTEGLSIRPRRITNGVKLYENVLTGKGDVLASEMCTALSFVVGDENITNTFGDCGDTMEMERNLNSICGMPYPHTDTSEVSSEVLKKEDITQVNSDSNNSNGSNSDIENISGLPKLEAIIRARIQEDQTEVTGPGLKYFKTTTTPVLVAFKNELVRRSNSATSCLLQCSDKSVAHRQIYVKPVVIERENFILWEEDGITKFKPDAKIVVKILKEMVLYNVILMTSHRFNGRKVYGIVYFMPSGDIAADEISNTEVKESNHNSPRTGSTQISHNSFFLSSEDLRNAVNEYQVSVKEEQNKLHFGPPETQKSINAQAYGSNDETSSSFPLASSNNEATEINNETTSETDDTRIDSHRQNKDLNIKSQHAKDAQYVHWEALSKHFKIVNNSISLMNRLRNGYEGEGITLSGRPVFEFRRALRLHLELYHIILNKWWPQRLVDPEHQLCFIRQPSFDLHNEETPPSAFIRFKYLLQHLSLSAFCACLGLEEVDISKCFSLQKKESIPWDSTISDLYAYTINANDDEVSRVHNQKFIFSSFKFCAVQRLLTLLRVLVFKGVINLDPPLTDDLLANAAIFADVSSEFASQALQNSTQWRHHDTQIVFMKKGFLRVDGSQTSRQVSQLTERKFSLGRFLDLLTIEVRSLIPLDIKELDLPSQNYRKMPECWKTNIHDNSSLKEPFVGFSSKCPPFEKTEVMHEIVRFPVQTDVSFNPDTTQVAINVLNLWHLKWLPDLLESKFEEDIHDHEGYAIRNEPIDTLGFRKNISLLYEIEDLKNTQAEIGARSLIQKGVSSPDEDLYLSNPTCVNEEVDSDHDISETKDSVMGKYTFRNKCPRRIKDQKNIQLTSEILNARTLSQIEQHRHPSLETCLLLGKLLHLSMSSILTLYIRDRGLSRGYAHRFINDDPSSMEPYGASFPRDALTCALVEETGHLIKRRCGKKFARRYEASFHIMTSLSKVGAAYNPINSLQSNGPLNSHIRASASALGASVVSGLHSSPRKAGLQMLDLYEDAEIITTEAADEGGDAIEAATELIRMIVLSDECHYDPLTVETFLSGAKQRFDKRELQLAGRRLRKVVVNGRSPSFSLAKNLRKSMYSLRQGYFLISKGKKGPLPESYSSLNVFKYSRSACSDCFGSSTFQRKRRDNPFATVSMTLERDLKLRSMVTSQHSREDIHFLQRVPRKPPPHSDVIVSASLSSPFAGINSVASAIGALGLSGVCAITLSRSEQKRKTAAFAASTPSSAMEAAHGLLMHLMRITEGSNLSSGSLSNDNIGSLIVHDHPSYLNIHDPLSESISFPLWECHANLFELPPYTTVGTLSLMESDLLYAPSSFETVISSCLPRICEGDIINLLSNDGTTSRIDNDNNVDAMRVLIPYRGAYSGSLPVPMISVQPFERYILSNCSSREDVGRLSPAALLNSANRHTNNTEVNTSMVQTLFPRCMVSGRKRARSFHENNPNEHSINWTFTPEALDRDSKGAQIGKSLFYSAWESGPSLRDVARSYPARQFFPSILPSPPLTASTGVTVTNNMSESFIHHNSWLNDIPADEHLDASTLNDVDHIQVSDSTDPCPPLLAGMLEFSIFRHMNGTPNMYVFQTLLYRVMDTIMVSPGITHKRLVRTISNESLGMFAERHVAFIVDFLKESEFITTVCCSEDKEESFYNSVHHSKKKEGISDDCFNIDQYNINEDFIDERQQSSYPESPYHGEVISTPTSRATNGSDMCHVAYIPTYYRHLTTDCVLANALDRSSYASPLTPHPCFD